MNSMSRDHYNSCKSESYKCNKPEPYKANKPEPCEKECKICPTIMSCDTCSRSSVSLGTVLNIPQTVASVKVNTSCLCNPVTKLEFSGQVTASIITAIAAASLGIVTVSFQVSRVCKGGFGPENIGDPFIVPATLLPAAVTVTTPFSFILADCNHCVDDCCVYTITATVTSLFGILLANLSSVALINPTLISTSSCGSDKCC